MNIGDRIPYLGEIKLKSNVPLIYKSVTQEQGEIFVAITDFSLKSILQGCTIEVSDFIKKDTIISEEKAEIVQNEGEDAVTIVIPAVTKTEYECVDVRNKPVSKEFVVNLFYMLNTPILTTDNFFEKLENLLQEALLFDTQYVPTKTGKLLYDCKPQDFEKC